MSNPEKIGIIGGQTIYADTGDDQIKILQAEIKKRVEQKKLKPGQRFMMMVYFERPLQIEVIISKPPAT